MDVLAAQAPDFLTAVLDSLRVAIGPGAAAFALAAVGLNLHFGYTGLLNFGQVAFMLVGAYGLAITVEAGGSMWLGIPIGLAASVLLALILGVPTLRLRADYLAIVTIATGEILRLVVRSNWAEDVTRGPKGILNVAEDFHDVNPFTSESYTVEILSNRALTFSNENLWTMVVGWGLVLLAMLLIYRLINSPWGRVIKSIREDEEAARSLGKNVFAYKMQSLVLGGVIGGLAGMVVAFNFISVIPDEFLPIRTFFLYTMIILGGAGTIFGPILGSVIFWFIVQFTESVLSQAVNRDLISADILTFQDISAIRFILVGLLLMALMIWRPQGILGKREELLIDV